MTLGALVTASAVLWHFRNRCIHYSSSPNDMLHHEACKQCSECSTRLCKAAISNFSCIGLS